MPQPDQPLAETLRQRMMAAGERLHFALKLEGQLHDFLLKDEDPVLFAQWKECRRTVDAFAEDYASSVTAYRKAVQAAVAERAGESRR